MEDMMTLTLRRHDICQIRMAILAIAQDFKKEAQDPDTTDTRREIAKSTAEMWYALRAEVIRQFNEQDPYRE